MIFNKFYTDLKRKGLEFFGLYYSIYEGKVVDNKDPKGRGRIKIKCPAVYGTNTPDIWVKGRGMFTGKGIGFYGIPQIGDPVWITFKGGDPQYPIWEYGWTPEGYEIEEAKEDVYIFKTPKGYKLVLNDSESEILIERKNESIKITDKIEIKAGGENYADVMNTFMTNIIQGMTVGAGGSSVWNPQTLAKLNQDKLKFNKIFK